LQFLIREQARLLGVLLTDPTHEPQSSDLVLRDIPPRKDAS
jgi:hypothetical protein